MKKKERQRERRKEIETIYKGMPNGKKNVCVMQLQVTSVSSFFIVNIWSPQGSVKKKLTEFE